MITTSKKLKEDYGITIGCIPECLDPFEKIMVEDTEIYISLTDISPSKEMQIKYPYYWFPIIENGKWSLETFEQFWLTVEKNLGKKMYIHCTAGVNRSRCLLYSFLKFRLRLSDEVISEYFPVHRNLEGEYRLIDRLFRTNQREGHIPSDEKLEQLHLSLLNK